MSRSLLKQLEAIQGTAVYDDTVSLAHTAGVAETQPTLAGDLNVLRTHIKDLLGTPNWFDASTTSLATLDARPDPALITILDYLQHGTPQATGTGGSTNITAQIFGALADESGIAKGLLASVTKGDIAGEGGKNRVDLVDSVTGDPIDDDAGNRVYAYLVVDSIAAPTVKTLFYYSEVGGTETAHSFTSTRTVIMTCRKRFTLEDVPETFALSGTNLVDNLSQEVDLGNLIYTEDNFVVDGSSFTANVDALDKAAEDHRLLLGTAAGVDAFALNTNLYSAAALSAQAAFNEIDNAINGTGSTNLLYTGANFITTTIDLEGALLELDAQVKTNETNITAASAQKEVEKAVGPLSSGVAHTLPGSLTYTLATGDNLDVYLNGQLLIEGATEDYLEDTTTTIKFNFNVGSNSNLTYFSRT